MKFSKSKKFKLNKNNVAQHFGEVIKYSNQLDLELEILSVAFGKHYLIFTLYISMLKLLVAMYEGRVWESNLLMDHKPIFLVTLDKAINTSVLCTHLSPNSSLYANYWLHSPLYSSHSTNSSDHMIVSGIPRKWIKLGCGQLKKNKVICDSSGKELNDQSF